MGLFHLFWCFMLKLQIQSDKEIKENENLIDFIMGFLIILCQIIWEDFGHEYFQQLLLHLNLKV